MSKSQPLHTQSMKLGLGVSQAEIDTPGKSMEYYKLKQKAEMYEQRETGRNYLAETAKEKKELRRKIFALKHHKVTQTLKGVKESAETVAPGFFARPKKSTIGEVRKENRAHNKAARKLDTILLRI